MKKKFVLFNTEINRYWTGKYWNTPYSLDIKNAKLFDDEESLIEEISTTEEENHALNKQLCKVKMFQVQVVYCNDI